MLKGHPVGSLIRQVDVVSTLLPQLPLVFVSIVFIVLSTNVNTCPSAYVKSIPCQED